MTDQPTPETDTRFIPPAAANLPPGVLDSATEGADRLDASARTPVGRNFLAHALAQLARDGWLRTEPGRDAADEGLRDQLAARDAALAAYTAQLVDDQAVLARLRSRVQAAADEARGSMRGWLVDALADLDDPRTPAPDGGPTVAECREVDRTWPLEKAGE